MHDTQQTLRVGGIPLSFDSDDVHQFFRDRIRRSHGRQIVESVGCLCQSLNGTSKSTTVSFSSPNTAKKALALQQSSRQLRTAGGGTNIISLDHEFLDLTTLYVSLNPRTGKPDVE